MTPEIEAVLASGATILVNAVATDAWKVTRAGFTKLFGRGVPEAEAATERRLEKLAAAVDQAEPDDRSGLRDRARADWLVRLTDLIDDDPAAIDDLRSLLGQLGAELPPEQQIWIQTNSARDDATIFAVQGGGTINVPKRPRRPE